MMTGAVFFLCFYILYLFNHNSSTLYYAREEKCLKSHACKTSYIGLCFAGICYVTLINKWFEKNKKNLYDEKESYVLFPFFLCASS